MPVKILRGGVGYTHVEVLLENDSEILNEIIEKLTPETLKVLAFCDYDDETMTLENDFVDTTTLKKILTPLTTRKIAFFDACSEGEIIWISQPDGTAPSEITRLELLNSLKAENKIIDIQDFRLEAIIKLLHHYPQAEWPSIIRTSTDIAQATFPKIIERLDSKVISYLLLNEDHRGHTLLYYSIYLEFRHFLSILKKVDSETLSQAIMIPSNFKQILLDERLSFIENISYLLGAINSNALNTLIASLDKKEIDIFCAKINKLEPLDFLRNVFLRLSPNNINYLFKNNIIINEMLPKITTDECICMYHSLTDMLVRLSLINYDVSLFKAIAERDVSNTSPIFINKIKLERDNIKNYILHHPNAETKRELLHLVLDPGSFWERIFKLESSVVMTLFGFTNKDGLEDFKAAEKQLLNLKRTEISSMTSSQLDDSPSNEEKEEETQPAKKYRMN